MSKKYYLFIYLYIFLFIYYKQNNDNSIEIPNDDGYGQYIILDYC